MPAPYGLFNTVPFDWAADSPQRIRRDGADYFTGTILLYAQADFDAFWGLRAVVNVRPIGDGTQNVYIDSWQPSASIQHTLSMSNARELHLAILTEMSVDQRHWRAQPTTPFLPVVVAFRATVEFLLLS